MRKMSGEAAASRCRPEIAVACAAPPELLAQAKELAKRLGLPLAENGARPQLLLRCTAEGLELLKPDDPQLRGPLRVDFTAGAMDFRRKQPGKELMLRAVGCKIGRPLAVIDATGGLGRDSFLLAAAGCFVHVFEQEPVLAALLADGLERAQKCPKTAAIAARIRLTAGDSLPFLHEMRAQGQVVDAIYLDPMFPERRKSALVKKEVQLLQIVAQHARPAEERLLLDAARAVSHRVAVKRPVKAPFLGEAAPSHSLFGTAVRFDVHLC